jgi:excisionase family DNA binding protein
MSIAAWRSALVRSGVMSGCSDLQRFHGLTPFCKISKCSGFAIQSDTTDMPGQTQPQSHGPTPMRLPASLPRTRPRPALGFPVAQQRGQRRSAHLTPFSIGPPSALVALSSSCIPASMISNRQIVDGVKDALFKAFKAWLDENRAEILKLTAEAGSAAGRGLGKREPEPASHPHFLTTAQLAERWRFHPESIRQMLRAGALVSLRMGGCVRVPLQEVERYEQQAILGRRR